MLKKPWQGCFSKETADAVIDFTASLPFDRRLALIDIRGSVAHVEMLAAKQIIPPAEAEQIIKGLGQLKKEIEEERFPYDIAFEDIHMNIEKRLIDIVGPVGGKLHTARSRNDQSALDMHLYVIEECLALERLLLLLQETLIRMVEKYPETIMPGYTHLQRAQPVLFSHHILAYFWMLDRDRRRLAAVFRGAAVNPLGAGALAGTGFPIDGQMVADKLGLNVLYENSIDAVSDRDYIIEFLSFASILIMHLSRLGEELVIWSSSEFGYIELDDAYTTGSSMMPQKKNPDVAELIRAKTGRIYGSLVAMLTVMKGLPLAYNKDMQEDKEGLFDAVDTLKSILPLLAKMLDVTIINEERIAAAVDDDYLCATDLSDYLVRQGISFREAHHAVGELIAHCRQNKLRLRELDPEIRRRFHPALAKEIRELLDPAEVVNARTSYGGTAPQAVREQLKKARFALNAGRIHGK